MARTPRTVELTSISTRFPLETRRWLEQRMKETGRQSLNEVLNDLMEDARSWYRLPKPVVDALAVPRTPPKPSDAPHRPTVDCAASSRLPGTVRVVVYQRPSAATLPR